MNGEMTIGDLARQVGVNVETIRYYERIGLLPNPARKSNGRRTYSLSNAQALTFIRKAREFGFSLEDIRVLLALRGPDNACSDVKAIAQRHLENLRAELQRTIRIERILSEAVDQCPGGATLNCTVLKTLETADA